MKRLMTAALVLLASLNAGAEGQDQSVAIAKCAAITASVARLDCYDAIGRAVPRGAPEVKAPAKSEGSGGWEVDVKANPVDDSKTVTLRLVEEGHAAALILRCQRGKAEAYIGWSKFIGSDNTQILTRLGDAKAETRRWSISTDHKGTFYPADNVAFMNQLSAVDKFVAQVTPYGASPVTAVFDVTGLSKAITPLKATCNIQ